MTVCHYHPLPTFLLDSVRDSHDLREWVTTSCDLHWLLLSSSTWDWSWGELIPCLYQVIQLYRIPYIHIKCPRDVPDVLSFASSVWFSKIRIIFVVGVVCSHFVPMIFQLGHILLLTVNTTKLHGSLKTTIIWYLTHLSIIFLIIISLPLHSNWYQLQWS